MSPTTVGAVCTRSRRLEIDWLLGAAHDADLQINDAVGAEAIHQRAGLGMSWTGDSGGHVDDALVAGAIGPIGEPRPDSWRGEWVARAPSRRLWTDQLAGFGVERDHRAPRAGGRVEHAPDHDRRAFQLVFRIGPEIVVLNRHATCSLSKLDCVDLDRAANSG